MLKWWPKSEIALGFLIAAPFWIAVLGWQASHSLTDRQKDECYETAKKTGYKDSECKSFWERTTSDPIALFNLILAFSTVGLWVATISLYRAGERQYRLAKETADRQAVEIQNQISIARDAARSAQKSADAAIASERARFYVGINHNFLNCINYINGVDSIFGREETLLSVGDWPQARISFHNYGKTPGIISDVSTGIVYSEVPPDPVYEVRVVNKNIVAGGEDSEAFGTLIDGQPTLRMADDVRSGVGNIWVFGYVMYEDVFGNPQSHRFLQRLVRVGSMRYVLQSYDYKHYNHSS